MNRSASIETPKFTNEAAAITDNVSRLSNVLKSARKVLGRSVLITGLCSVALASYDLEPAEAFTPAGYPNMGAMDYDVSTYTWWVDENQDRKAQVTPSETDNDESMSPRLYGYRNCTDGVAYWAQQHLGKSIPGWGHAANWNEAGAARGYVVKGGDSKDIEPGDIAQSDDGSFGHVGFVTVVEKSVDGSIKSVSVAEMNAAGTGNSTHTNYSVKNSAGKFKRNSSYDWDHFIDINGGGVGIDGAPLNQPTPVPVPVDLPTFVPDIVQRPDGETNVAAVGPGNSLDFYYNRAGSSQWGKVPVAIGGYALSSPDMIQRPSGETDIAVVGKDNSLDFYMNQQGSPAWGKLTVAGPGSAYSKPAIIQRPSGETNIAVRGPGNTLDFYYNLPGSPHWGKVPVATPNQAYSAPAMVQRTNGETDIAVLGPENSLNFYFNQQGSPYWGLSRVAINGWAHSAPAMIQRPSGETDIAVQGPSNTLDFYFNQQGSPYWGRVRAAGGGSTHTAPNAPAMAQRANGETDITVRGPGDSADFYFNSPGSSTWGKVPVAIPGYSQRTPAMIQRPTTGETDLAIIGPSNRLDFYFNALGSPYWGNIPIAPDRSAS